MYNAQRTEVQYSAAVITVSDRCSAGLRQDTSGPAVCRLLTEMGLNIRYTSVLPDDKEEISRELLYCTDEIGTELVITTGGTGFSKRDVTPEATLAVIQRNASGISEAMRAESMKMTPRGCLSRGVSGIRNNSLIINLPGSEKAACECLDSVKTAVAHGLEMLCGEEPADCAGEIGNTAQPWQERVSVCFELGPAEGGSKTAPSMDVWKHEAAADERYQKCGMLLFHNGTVRATPKAAVRGICESTGTVAEMQVMCNEEKLKMVMKQTAELPGIYYIRAWINQGRLFPGDDLMLLLIGGDIRPRVISALEFLLTGIKEKCITEREILFPG